MQMIERTAHPKNNYPPVNLSKKAAETDLPPEIISKIVLITSKGNDATVKRKKDGYKVYETKLVEK